MQSNQKIITWSVYCLCLLVSFAGVIDRDLWRPDEPRVAAIALEMSRNGDWVIPHLANKPFIEKPPLYFAVAAGFLHLLGDTVGKVAAIRLSSVFWGLGILLMTYLLIGRVLGNKHALPGTAVLATMIGFVENTHWIRVDIALAFFVVASVWCLSEVFFRSRKWFLLPAGIFTAGSFLAKGTIGPLFVGIAWFGMVLPLLMRGSFDKESFRTYVIWHFYSLLVFMGIAGVWIIMLKVQGGPELWHEWFWRNQVGRFIGTARLGHEHSDPIYYLRTLFLYTLPWAPLVIVWVQHLIKDIVSKRPIPLYRWFILICCVISVLMLSLSATKREPYLFPVMPVFAFMCADALKLNFPRWCRFLFWGWMILCMVSLVVMGTSPIWYRFLPADMLPQSYNFIRLFTFRHAIAIVGAGICLFFTVGKSTVSLPLRMIAVTAIFYIGMFAVAWHAIDMENGIRNKINEFVDQIPPEKRAGIAGYRLYEYARADFYFYCNWVIPEVKDYDQLQQILEGKDGTFHSIILDKKGDLSKLIKVPFRVTAEDNLGSVWVLRPIRLVEGVSLEQNSL